MQKLNWLQREKLKDPTYTQADTQLAVQKLPPDLLPKVRKWCKANDLRIRWFVEEALKTALRERLGERKKSR